MSDVGLELEFLGPKMIFENKARKYPHWKTGNDHSFISSNEISTFRHNPGNLHRCFCGTNKTKANAMTAKKLRSPPTNDSAFN